MSRTTLLRRSVAEGVGTALLLVAIVGSGIMGERLSGGNTGLALLANTLATGAGLASLILAFGLISGAHFNPVVTAADVWLGRRSWKEARLYMLAQLAGAVGGVGLANLMFQEPIFALSRRPRGGWLLIVSEFVATFGLVLVLWGFLRKRASGVPYAVAAYISAAYWFTPSTSFANPAATLARALTDTFAGIRPVDVPGFIVAECFGAAAATFLFAWLAPTVPAAAVERGVSTPRRGESHGPRDIRLPS